MLDSKHRHICTQTLARYDTKPHQTPTFSDTHRLINMADNARLDFLHKNKTTHIMIKSVIKYADGLRL